MIKLFTAVNAPNPRALENIIAIKQIEVETITVDLIGGENRGDDYVKTNPAGQLPALNWRTGR